MAKIKPKVSTKYGGYFIKIQKIIDLLKEYPEGMTPKEIAHFTRIGHNTVKGIVRKMPELKQKDGRRGLYYLVDETTHSIFDWTFHNLILTYKSLRKMGKSEKKLNEGSFSNLLFKTYRNGTIEMRVNSQTLFNLATFDLILYLFKREIKSLLDLFPEDCEITVSSIEFNKDYYNLRLDKINSITITNLFSQYKLYQKKLRVRYEIKPSIKMNAEILSSLLYNQEFSLDVYGRMDKLEKSNKTLQKSQEMLIKLVKKLLEKC